MFYKSQLDLLCQTFNKFRISTQIISFKQIKEKENLMHSASEELKLNDLSILHLFGIIENQITEREILITTNSYKLKYLVLLLPSEKKQDDSLSQKELLIIGPYLTSPLKNEKVLEIAESNNLSSLNLTAFQNFLSIAPIIDKDSFIFTLLETFCENLWQGESFCYKEVSDKRINPLDVSLSGLINREKEVQQVNVAILEQTYKAENDMMDMISFGQLSKIKQMLSNFNASTMKKRLSDSLRNIKNYAIITNTLMRKAAEKGGVHPLYLDDTSSFFAKSIERCLSETQCFELIKDMFITYCKLVQNYSTKNYSPIVKKTMFYVLSNLSEKLTLCSIAQNHKVSKGYLSAVFKKETGKTLTDFIIEKRMQYAGHLLSSTNLKLHSVAMNCGILDMQYFAKLFKKVMGVSPNKYRKQFVE